MSRRKKGPTGDYDVGYCKPPVSGQFQKGTSGNPSGKGRSKNQASSTKTQTELLHEIGSRPIRITLNGTQITVTMFEAVAIKTFQAALDGKQDAVRTIFKASPAVDEMLRRRPDIPDDEELARLAKDPEAIAATYRRLFGPRLATPLVEIVAARARGGHRSFTKGRRDMFTVSA